MPFIGDIYPLYLAYENSKGKSSFDIPDFFEENDSYNELLEEIWMACNLVKD